MNPDEQTNELQTGLLEQYSELCNDSRHYDQKLWLIPGAAFTIAALFWEVIVDSGKAIQLRTFASGFQTVIFSAFLFQYVKDRAFQLEIQNVLSRFPKSAKGMLSVSQYSGHLLGDAKDRWFIKLMRNRSASNYVFYVMLAGLVGQLAITLYLGYSWLTCSSRQS